MRKIKTSNMHMHINKGVPYLTFNMIDRLKDFTLKVSTRHGGVSQIPECASLNLGTSTSDKYENIKENYRIFCDAAGFDINTLVLAKQTHSANIRLVTNKDKGKGVLRERDYTDIDGLITNIPGITLVIHTADCVPVAIIDPVNKAIGNSHCGWRGTYTTLASKTLDAMTKNFGTKPADVYVAIGPCICMDCYEVSKELYEDFKAKFNYDDCIVQKEEKYYLNLAYINKRILQDAGVGEENIIVSDICTCCNKEDMFSHRGLGLKRGILGTFLKIKE